MNRRIVFVLLGVALLISCVEYSESSGGETLRRISLWPESPALSFLSFLRLLTAIAGVFLIWLGWPQSRKS